jgi:hypothetical protein
VFLAQSIITRPSGTMTILLTKNSAPSPALFGRDARPARSRREESSELFSTEEVNMSRYLGPIGMGGRTIDGCYALQDDSRYKL